MADWNIQIEADPTWEPMTIADVLDQDGVYCGVITGEKPTKEDADKPGIWLTIELQDADVAGKRLQKLLIDPRQNSKVMFLWRGLMMSIAGKNAARQAFTYAPGAFLNRTCYFKVAAYLTNKGDLASGVNDWLTKEDFDEAVKKGRTRWPRQVSAKSGDVGAFGLPTGLPTGFGAPVVGMVAPHQPSAPVAQAEPSLAAADEAVKKAPAVPQPVKPAFPAFPGLK